MREWGENTLTAALDDGIGFKPPGGAPLSGTCREEESRSEKR